MLFGVKLRCKTVRAPIPTCRPPFRHGSPFSLFVFADHIFSQVLLSQRATCHILNGHEESTSLFEAAEGVGQKGGCRRSGERRKGGSRRGTRTEKGGCGRDHWEGKSRKRQRKRGVLAGKKEGGFFGEFGGRDSVEKRVLVEPK